MWILYVVSALFCFVFSFFRNKSFLFSLVCTTCFYAGFLSAFKCKSWCFIEVSVFVLCFSFLFCEDKERFCAFSQTSSIEWQILSCVFFSFSFCVSFVQPKIDAYCWERALVISISFVHNKSKNVSLCAVMSMWVRVWDLHVWLRVSMKCDRCFKCLMQKLWSVIVLIITNFYLYIFFGWTCHRKWMERTNWIAK